ncbi:MAG TPA: LysR family transcriptional regulator [Gammaproteobacteria bacterium]|nr:LysR family transcriptional regulator [Gammaproteobacteria bacterium]
MKETLITGLEKTAHITIDKDRTIGFVGDDCRVYSTPSLLRDIENCCRDLLLEHLHEGEDSVGTRVVLDHTGATLLGMQVQVAVSITEINRRQIGFDFIARDSVEEIARGSHNRFVIDKAKTASRLRAKAAQADAS